MAAAVVGDLTDCSICMYELNDPRFLPCHHTFCLHCIAELQQRTRAGTPCPLCRSVFNSPAAGLRKNYFAEELVSVSRERELLTDELEAVRTQLGETEVALAEATEEKRRHDAALTETRSRLVALEDRSCQAERRLESRVEELERSLSAAESRELCLRELQRETTDKLTDAERRCEAAKIEAETSKRAKNESERSLATAKQSCRSLREQLQQAQGEASQRLKDAERQQERTRLDAERCQKAKNNAEASLVDAKQKCRSLRQQNQQLQRDSGERARVPEAELSGAKQDIVRLNKQLAIERIKLEQHGDYKKSHAEVIRLCFVLLALLLLSATGAFVLLEDRSSAALKVKETQLFACNDFAERLEESSLKLATARFEIRNTLRTLNDCSDQLAETKHTLHATEIKLKDANDVLSRTKVDKCKLAKAASNSATKEEDSSCTRQLAEARANLKTKETMLKNVSSHMTQEREDKLLAAATAEECSLHRKWLQQRLEEYMIGLPQDPMIAVKGELPPETENRDCSCEDTNAVLRTTETGADKTTNRVEKVTNPNSSSERAGSDCSRQLTEARADLKTRETLSRNCSRRLARERESRTKATRTAEACARQLNRSRCRPEPTARECDARLNDTRKNLSAASDALKQCVNDLSASKEAERTVVRDCGKRQSAKLKDVSAKLTKCDEELATAAETLRWKTKQNNKCAENLVQARGEVQSLTTQLTDTDLSCSQVVEGLQRRYQDSLADLELRHEQLEQELKRTAQNCAGDDDLMMLKSPVIKLFLVPLIFGGYYWLTLSLFFLLLWFGYYVMMNRFGTLLGIRGRRVEYGVHFRRRYR